ncbi:Lrp/AsnC family transcriptional regulator [Roseofilum casamattae]|uniref:Lrp/AsnC family transcriptional regulator n=1 Tax=Roseofilum casamattae BLCC-M143 TaxID=3022442 RepID=A0ABT7BY44_9CYAN|nr:Lrp/AsnC family transcriptional regulator [Roseofilum casamattae]MDJ1183203.1 Lrp/AsnC family transcriptional regulator [Roseofilum casamattae BLCC-M143]
MTFDSEKLLDRTGWQILKLLQEDARLSFAELGRTVGLSAPAIAERVRRMEEAGIILGYHARLAPEKLGYAIAAIISLTTTPQQYPQVLELVDNLPEVRSCRHVTGGCSFLIEVNLPAIARLEDIIAEFSRFGHTSTSIVLSSPAIGRSISPPE